MLRRPVEITPQSDQIAAPRRGTYQFFAGSMDTEVRERVKLEIRDSDPEILLR